MKAKFAPTPFSIRHKAMAEYLEGGVTACQIGQKYGFAHRRLRVWFQEEGKLKEFEAIAHMNMVGFAKLPMTIVSKAKISGINHIAWKGKKLEVRNGTIRTVLLLRPDHPDATVDGYVPEHRLVMGEALGRRLTATEVVHHIDLNPTNNELDNLLLMSNTEHALLHAYLQIALVQLMEVDDLRALSKHLLELVKHNGPIRKRHNRKRRGASA